MPATIRDIARRAGVSTATVSLILRGVGNFAPQTRKKVREAAKALDYKPHPLVARAFSLVRQSGGRQYRETLAFIAEWETETGPEHQREIHAAALARAAELGYKLETFLLSGKPSDHRRLSRVLRARGVRGLIVIPRLGTLHPRLHFDWEHFAAVEIGRTIWHPRNLHRVQTSNFPTVLASLHFLKRIGYKRIGMAVEPMQNHHEDCTYYAAFLHTQIRQPEAQRIPILAPTGPWNEKSFRAWIKQYKPDVIYAHATLAQVICSWLERLNMRVPGDISLFCTNVQDKRWTGMRRNYAGMGSSAVEMVCLLLQNNELGLPLHPRSWQVDESWEVGTTLSRPIKNYLPDGLPVEQRWKEG